MGFVTLLPQTENKKLHNKSLNRSGGWTRNLKSTSLDAARLAQALCAKEMFDAIDLSKFVVTPLTDAEFAELSTKCDRRIPDSVRQLLQTIGVPQNVCYSLPDDEDRFLSYQQGIPTEYCVFARDDSDDNLYAVGPDDSLFRLDPYQSAIHKLRWTPIVGQRTGLNSGMDSVAGEAS